MFQFRSNHMPKMSLQNENPLHTFAMVRKNLKYFVFTHFLTVFGTAQIVLNTHSAVLSQHQNDSSSNQTVSIPDNSDKCVWNSGTFRYSSRNIFPFSLHNLCCPERYSFFSILRQGFPSLTLSILLVLPQKNLLPIDYLRKDCEEEYVLCLRLPAES